MEPSTPKLAIETEALKKAYAGLNANDLAPMVNLFDPHIEWVEPSEFPQGGIYHGREAVKAHLSKARDRWAEGTCECERLILGGDKIVAFDYVHVRLKDEVEWREGPVTAVYTFRQGRIVHTRIFVDREQALEWAGIPDQPR